MKIPAICESCNAIFPSPINVASGASGTITDCTVPCPKCHATARILDGVYKTLNNAVHVLLEHPDPNVLRRFIGVLQEARNREQHRDELANNIKNATPKLRRIGDVLPKNNTDFYAFVLMLLAVAAFLRSD